MSVSVGCLWLVHMYLCVCVCVCVCVQGNDIIQKLQAELRSVKSKVCVHVHDVYL